MFVYISWSNKSPGFTLSEGLRFNETAAKPRLAVKDRKSVSISCIRLRQCIGACAPSFRPTSFCPTGFLPKFFVQSY